jgi:4,5-DOPA dioxygenase extradiol
VIVKIDLPESDLPLPALFVGHGSPMNAIEDNAFSRAWLSEGRALPRPAAILCISAHWETDGTRVTAQAQPPTIHDFGGFPRALYEQQYPAPGSPELAQLVCDTVTGTQVRLDHAWGLDHGTWSVLRRLFPAADVPVVQLSLDRALSPADHYALAQQLRPLRRRGVLVVGSGNIVHNLRRVDWQDGAYDWAVEFDTTVERLIRTRDHAALIHYPDLGPAARLAVPTNEHYQPLLYALALQADDEPVTFFAEGVTLGSISMRSLRLG